MSTFWICPSCQRRFGRAGQSHECAPALTLEDYFSSGPSFERPIFDTVSAFVETLGTVLIEPVQVGVFFKRPASWIQLRPRVKWVSLLFPSPRNTIDHRAITTKPSSTGRPGAALWFDAKLRIPTDFDEELQGLLIESWHAT
jgi:hypothetical protein